MKYTSSNDTNNKKSTLIPLLWTIFAIALSFGFYSVIPLYLFLLLVIGYIIGGIIVYLFFRKIEGVKNLEKRSQIMVRTLILLSLILIIQLIVFGIAIMLGHINL